MCGYHGFGGGSLRQGCNRCLRARCGDDTGPDKSLCIGKTHFIFSGNTDRHIRGKCTLVIGIDKLGAEYQRVIRADNLNLDAGIFITLDGTGDNQCSGKLLV